MPEGNKLHLKNFIVYILVLAGVIGGAVLLFSKDYAKVEKTTDMTRDDVTSIPENYKTYSTPPEMHIDVNRKYFADVTTNLGMIRLELFAKDTPNTVNNFIFLSREGFYDNIPFHRVIKDFMIQGGDPKGDGTGGPGYKFADEKITRDYKRGIVAMANAGPDTNGSQFFIMHKDYDLPKNYVIFGQVTDGMDTVDKIAESPVELNGAELSKPKEKITLEKITISEE